MHFLVLPDSPRAAGIAERVPRGERVLRHASGRPWIVGDWHDGEVWCGAHGAARVALFGCAATTPERLDRALRGVRRVAELDDLAAAVPGSHHLVASAGGETRVQGTLSGAREVFWATVDGVAVAADRADPLVALTPAEVDATTLACHLMAQPPWPLSDRPVWRGIATPGPGRYLLMTAEGTGTAERWWTPQAAELPLRQGAERVRGALRDAVAARTAGYAGLSTDLSGGMDSTSLAFLVARERGSEGLLTVRREAADPANDDAEWADLAATYLPGSRPLVLSRRTTPYSFAGQLLHDDGLEAPYAWTRVKSEVSYVAEELAAHGATLQLTGHGGDELFNPAPSAYHALARRHPLRAVPALRAARSMYRWPLGALTRNLLRGADHHTWLGMCARMLTTPNGGPKEPFTGWGGYPRLPAWVTGEAAEACRRLLREAAAERVRGHAADPAQHEIVQAVRQCGASIRLTDRRTARHGVGYHAPFLDDQVLGAALAVRLVDRVSPTHTKPVLAAAMRGTVPDPVLDRATKGEFSAEVYEGVRRHKPELLALCDDMRLARHGLVDAAAVRAAVVAPHPTSRTFIPMVRTLACESWLRSVEAARVLPDAGLGHSAEARAEARAEVVRAEARAERRPDHRPEGIR